MNGRLAKAIRKTVRFHPAMDRGYQVVARPNSRVTLVDWPNGTAISVGKRSHYQKFKAGVLNRKRMSA